MAGLFFLGIDTSCYTTSLALIDARGFILNDWRLPLPVAAGELGLRQSDAVFHHLRHMLQQFSDNILPATITAIGASTRPRPQPDSYMPVFLVGETLGLAMAGGAGAPFYRFSHQEGHIAAGLKTELLTEPVLAVHLSGGTSEILLVNPASRPGYEIDLLAATSDLSAGQMIDRVGVAMGLPFPAGPSLEQLARRAAGHLRLPSAATGLSFSGPCSAAERFLQKGEDPREVAFATLRVVANTLEKTLRPLAEKHGINQVLFAGGVMSNRLIRLRLERRLAARLSLRYAEPNLCTDNAVGIAFLTRAAYLQANKLK